jgi:hypothetical protein
LFINLVIINIAEVVGINSQIDLKQELLALEVLGNLKQVDITLGFNKLATQERRLVAQDHSLASHRQAN